MPIKKCTNHKFSGKPEGKKALTENTSMDKSIEEEHITEFCNNYDHNLCNDLYNLLFCFNYMKWNIFI